MVISTNSFPTPATTFFFPKFIWGSTTMNSSYSTQFTGQAKSLAVRCKIPPLESYKIFHLLTLSAPSSLLLLLCTPNVTAWLGGFQPICVKKKKKKKKNHQMYKKGYSKRRRRKKNCQCIKKKKKKVVFS